MKILACHNYYQQPGGEDQSFAAETELLESRGHRVIRYTLHNDAIQSMGRLEVARRTLWNPDSHRELREIIERERPDVMHCSNTFPLISPSAYHAATAAGVPVVQTLRNFRLVCLNGLFHRRGAVCEKCLGKPVPWPGVAHRCYRGSRSGSAVVAGMLTVHRALGTWKRHVDLFVALTEFSRRKFVEAGLDAGRIVVKPNFVHPDPGPGTGGGGFAMFVGRLSPEKGLDTLITAWSRLRRSIPLRVVGDGPLADAVRAAADRNPSIRWEGRRSPDEVLAMLGDADFLVMPSEWYETFGRTIIESYARGTPVIASRMGTRIELVEEGGTGLLFETGDPDDLARAVERLLAPETDLPRMRRRARDLFERAYAAGPNYDQLLAIYTRVLARSGPRSPVPDPSRPGA